MITAPDVFEVTGGTYTPTVAIDWVAHHGDATMLHIGRTLRYTTAHGWEVGPQTPTPKPIWKSLAKSAKTVKRAFDDAGAPGEAAEGYYELIGPGIGGNLHGRSDGDFAIVRHGEDLLAEQPPRTSLYALAKWITERGLTGILWRWDEPGADGPRFAAVRVDLLP